MLELLKSLDSDVVGAALILSVIGAAAMSITVVCLIADTFKSITMAKMQKSMIEDMLAKGFTPEEVERLVYGGKAWHKLRRLFQRDVGKDTAGNTPRPPVKHSV